MERGPIKILAILNRNLEEGYDVIEELKNYRINMYNYAIDTSGMIMEALESECDEDEGERLKHIYFYSSIYEELLRISDAFVNKYDNPNNNLRHGGNLKNFNEYDLELLDKSLKSMGLFTIKELITELQNQLKIKKIRSSKINIIFHYPQRNYEEHDLLKKNNMTDGGDELKIFKKILSKYMYNKEIKFKKCKKSKTYKIIIKYWDQNNIEQIIKIENDFEKRIYTSLISIEDFKKSNPKPNLLECVLVSNDSACFYCKQFRHEWIKLKQNFKDLKFTKYDFSKISQEEVESILKIKIFGVPSLYLKFGNSYQEVELRGDELKNYIEKNLYS